MNAASKKARPLTERFNLFSFTDELIGYLHLLRSGQISVREAMARSDLAKSKFSALFTTLSRRKSFWLTAATWHFMTPSQIRTLRRKLKLSPDEFAARLCFTGKDKRITIWRWGTGKRKPEPQIILLMRQIATSRRPRHLRSF